MPAYLFFLYTKSEQIVSKLLALLQLNTLLSRMAPTARQLTIISTIGYSLYLRDVIINNCYKKTDYNSWSFNQTFIIFHSIVVDHRAQNIRRYDIHYVVLWQ